MVVVDITSKANRIYNLYRAGVNENAADYDLYYKSPWSACSESHRLKQTSNIEHRTPNIECSSATSQFGIRGSVFDVRCFLHFGVLTHSSHPPSSTKTQFFPSLSFSCASSRSRRATSTAALQLSALQYTTTLLSGDHCPRNCGSNSFQSSSFNRIAPGI